MTINFYNSSEDVNVFPKSPTATFSASGVLKDDTSMTNPVIVLEYNPEISNSNYFYLSDFERFYYITGVEFSQKRMFVTGKVDVLNSFASDILNLDAYVARECIQTIGSGSSGEKQVLPNILLPDNFVPVQVDRIVKVTGQNDAQNTNFASIDPRADDGSWVLLVNGGPMSSS